ncbi:MAG TPA: hypothetical protein VGD67_15640 [Pseudonocardiaceae bacterium]
MKKTMGAVAALFAMMATLLLGTATAQATTPPSHCYNTGSVVNVIVCEIDVDDNGIIDGNDVKVLIPVIGNLSHNDLVVLAQVLDDLNIGLKDIDIDVLNGVVVEVLENAENLVVINGPLVVLPCGCPHGTA